MMIGVRANLGYTRPQAQILTIFHFPQVEAADNILFGGIELSLLDPDFVNGRKVRVLLSGSK